MSSVSNGRRIYPSLTGQENEFTAPWCNEGMKAWTAAAKLLNRQISHLCVTLHDLLVLTHRCKVHWAACLQLTGHYVKEKPHKATEAVLFGGSKNNAREHVEICLGESGGWQILATDVQVNSLRVNQLLMHADNSQTGTAQTASHSLSRINFHTHPI